jgi:hypothetical protein
MFLNRKFNSSVFRHEVGGVRSERGALEAYGPIPIRIGRIKSAQASNDSVVSRRGLHGPCRTCGAGSLAQLMCQSKYRPDRLEFSEASRYIDGDAIGQRATGPTPRAVIRRWHISSSLDDGSKRRCRMPSSSRTTRRMMSSTQALDKSPDTHLNLTVSIMPKP